MSLHENTPSNRDPVYKLKRSGKASKGTEVNQSRVFSGTVIQSCLLR